MKKDTVTLKTDTLAELMGMALLAAQKLNVSVSEKSIGKRLGI